MLDKDSLQQYKDYRRTIGEQCRERTEAGIAHIREGLGIADDLMEMLNVLCQECETQQGEISRLEEDKRGLNGELSNLRAQIEKFQTKDEFYSRLSLDSATLTALIRDNKAREEELKEKQEALDKEREEFEEEKTNLLDAKKAAEDNAEEYREKWEEEQRAGKLLWRTIKRFWKNMGSYSSSLRPTRTT